MFRLCHIAFLTICFFCNFAFAQNVTTDSISTDNEKPKINIGGAFRVHYKNEFYNPQKKRQGGEFAYDVLGLNFNIGYKKFKVYADMRFMAPSYGGTMLREGWIGYNLENNDDILVGLIEDPFGNLQYNSYSWFLGIGYGMGFEGKYSIGTKYHHKGKKWEWQAAFLKNAMETFSNDPDLRDNQWSTSVLGENKEINQFTGQLVYKINHGNSKHRIGVSAKVGQLYNFVQDLMGNRNAFVLHYNLERKQFGIKAQAYKYQYNAKGGNPDFVEAGAFNYTYPIVSNGKVVSIATKYSFPFKNQNLNEIMLYSEYGALHKEKGLDPSKMFTNGALFRAFNSLYIYLECVAGKNHPFLGGDHSGLYNVADNQWKARLQCNFGYYF